VQAVLTSAGAPLPDGVRRDMELGMGLDFSDVRVHTDARAAASARLVEARAYAVGRAIVFAEGQFNPHSFEGRRLIAHELGHVGESPHGGHAPTGPLLISAPWDPGERRADRAAEAALRGDRRGATHVPFGFASAGLHRQAAAPVQLNAVNINHRKVSVPAAAGLGLRAVKAPPSANGVQFSLVAETATLATGTTINASTGAIALGPGQTGGRMHADALQTIPLPNSTPTTVLASSAPMNLVGTPAGIASTTSGAGPGGGFYGGTFTHTFNPPSGSAATALEFARVNERFPGASGTHLTVTGNLGTINVTVNNPTSPTAGWGLDASGTMAGPDHVTWSNGVDARPFVPNASNPAPASGLPQQLLATQNFVDMRFPAGTWGTAIVASTTHRRAIEERGGPPSSLHAVTSSNAVEVVEDYAGPTVFRRCLASPNSLPVSVPALPNAGASAPSTTTVHVTAEGAPLAPVFTIQGPARGCTINPSTGVLTSGTTPGIVTVRAGAGTNFDETTVTIFTPAPSPAPGPSPTPDPAPKPGPTPKLPPPG
jgi:hypothetical protein